MKKRTEQKKGFQTPKGYFEEFDSRLDDRMSNESNRGFKVPKGYFEDLEDQVMSEVLSGGGSRRVRTRILWMAAAASILLFFGVKYMNPGQEEIGWQDLQTAEIDAWIARDLDELDPYDIAEVYPEMELDLPYATDAEIEAYLTEIELEEILFEN